jgi:DNA-binding transcriptional LysR family regulator
MRALRGEFGVASMSVQVTPSTEVVRQVLDGVATLGVAVSAGESPLLRCTPVLSAPLGLLVAPGCPIPEKIESLADLASVPMVRLTGQTPVTRILQQAGVDFSSYFNATVSVACVVTAFELMREERMATIASGIVASHAHANGMRFIPLPQLLPTAMVHVVSRRDMQFDERQEIMRDVLRSSICSTSWHPSVRPVGRAVATQQRPRMSGAKLLAKMSAARSGFSIRQAQSFLAVAESGSFTAAAHQIHISQSGLSRMIGDLEQELGEPLFERVTQGVRLTAAGRAFMPYAQKLTDSYIRALHGLKSLQPDRVTIASSGALALGLHTLLPAPNEGDAQDAVQIKVMECHQVVAAVVAGHADIGLAMLPEHTDGVLCETLLETPLGLLGAPDVNIPDSPVSLSDLRHFHFLRLADEMVVPGLLYLHHVDLPRYFHAVVTCNSMASLLSLLAAGHGVTIVPSPVAQSALASGMKFLPLPELLPRLKLVLLSRGDPATAQLEIWRTKIRQYTLSQPWAVGSHTHAS